jgi:hypothetical protein
MCLCGSHFYINKLHKLDHAFPKKDFWESMLHGPRTRVDPLKGTIDILYVLPDLRYLRTSCLS